MTSESRTLIEPRDILGVECECKHCGVKHLIPLESFDRGVPSECPNCHEKWIEDGNEAQTLSYFVRCLKEVDELAAKKNAKQKESMRIRFQVAIVVFVCVLIASVPARAQTTLFGTTLGQPDPQLRCGDQSYLDFIEHIQHSPLCGLGDNAEVGPVIDELDGNVGQITAWWLPVGCSRVGVALKAKFQSPSVSGWRGKNGLGLPINGTVWTWKRKNGDVIQFVNPSDDGWPDCELKASTAKWRAQPKEKDHL